MNNTTPPIVNVPDIRSNAFVRSTMTLFNAYMLHTDPNTPRETTDDMLNDVDRVYKYDTNNSTVYVIEMPDPEIAATFTVYTIDTKIIHIVLECDMNATTIFPLPE